jgi:hypothetical protein
MRLKVRMKQLKEGEVQRLSLVRRAANMIPFRIQKAAEGEHMLDLTSIRRLVTKSDRPVVSAVVVMRRDGVDLGAVKEAIQKSGFSVADPVENPDGSIVFGQVPDPEVDAHVVRMSDNLVLVMKGWDPYASKMQSFSEQLGTDGYYDGLMTGTNALREVVRKCVTSARDHDEMRSLVKKALDDFYDYALGLSDSIPPSANMVDEALGAMQPVQKAAAEEVKVSPKEETVDHDKTNAPEKVGDEKKVVEKAAEAEKPGVKVEGKTPEKSAEAAAEKVEKGAEKPAEEKPVAAPAPSIDPMAKVLEAITGLVQKVELVQKAQEEHGKRLDQVSANLTGKVQEVVEKAAEAERKAADAQGRVRSTVNALPTAFDQAPVRRVVEKSDDDGPGPHGEGYWDSALASRGRF